MYVVQVLSGCCIQPHKPNTPMYRKYKGYKSTMTLTATLLIPYEWFQFDYIYRDTEETGNLYFCLNSLPSLRCYTLRVQRFYLHVTVCCLYGQVKCLSFGFIWFFFWNWKSFASFHLNLRRNHSQCESLFPQRGYTFAEIFATLRK